MYLDILIINHWMKDSLETHLEKVHSKEICLESHLLIHLLDLLDGEHLTHTYLYHHGINHLLCNLFQNQQPSYHTRSYNTQPMSKTYIRMLTSKYSRRPLKLMVKQWKLTSSTCLVLLSRIIFLNGVKTSFKTIQTALLKSWNKHFVSNSKL